MSLKGIDVSYANGSIDWSKVKKNIDFAIIRSSFGSDLPSQTDSQFHQNASGCVKNNIPFGIYHFAYFVDEDTAKDEADFAIRLAKEYNGVRFIALDIEEDSERYAKRIGKYPNWTACCIAFMERIKQAGYLPVLYSNQDWLINKLNYEKVRHYNLWYAAPGASAPKYSPSIWQYSWIGKMDGINGNVDMNLSYEDQIFDIQQEKSKNSNGIGETNDVSQLYSSQIVEKTVTIVSDNGVNIRKGAGTSYDIIGAIPNGENVKIIRQTSDKNYIWGLTIYQGKTGWIALNYTKETKKKIIKVGDIVKVCPGAKVYCSEEKLSSWVYETVFNVVEISSDGNRIVIGLNGYVTAAVHKNDIIPVK